MGDTAEATKASAMEIDISTVVDNVESTEIEMETIRDMPSLLAVVEEEGEGEGEAVAASPLMDSAGDLQGPPPNLAVPESQQLPRHPPPPGPQRKAGRLG